jgi:GR25 family glycosyltransferase involved in LPS biosynthesis
MAKCQDHHLITDWVCVDDNSPEEDRVKMKDEFPHIEFIFKTPTQRGHGHSMNIIRNLALERDVDFIVHVEDDHEFLWDYPLLTHSIRVLLEHPTYGQCLFNLNYGEEPRDIHHQGGVERETEEGVRYYEHVQGLQVSGPSSTYWPHFSLRPGVWKASILKCGDFIEHSHFELDYALRFVDAGFKTVFLDGIFCEHIGRKTKDRFGQEMNAYTLNNTTQFGTTYSTYIINLDRRQDRWIHLPFDQLTNVLRVHAVDGLALQPSRELHALFRENLVDMTPGIIGCALSHLLLHHCLLPNFKQKSISLVLEDDISVCSEFQAKCAEVLGKLSMSNWDMVFIGHHSKEPPANTDDLVLYKAQSTAHSFQLSYGGTFGYFVRHTAIPKIKSYIQQYGMTNAIDTVFQKCIDHGLNVYYPSVPLVTSPMYTSPLCDSDIQGDTKRLHLPTPFEPLEDFDLESYLEKMNSELNLFPST